MAFVRVYAFVYHIFSCAHLSISSSCGFMHTVWQKKWRVATIWCAFSMRCEARRGENKNRYFDYIIFSICYRQISIWVNAMEKLKKKMQNISVVMKNSRMKKISLFIFRRWSFFHVLSRLKWMEFLLKINIICNGDDDDDDDANTFLFGIYSTHPYSFIALLSSIFFFISFGKKLWRRNSTMEKKMCEANFGKFDGRHEIIDEIWIISTYFFTIN